MIKGLSIRNMRREEAPEVLTFVLSIFEKYLFRDYPETLQANTYKLVTEEYLLASDESAFTWVAEIDSKIVGMVKTKRGNHISLLFVKEKYWRAGIGQFLLNAAIKEISSRIENVTCVTLNSSKFAMHFYENAGFKLASEERTLTPMKLVLLQTSCPG
jgi:ribosomal protein S18 acetylase RimI-like enzyme